MNFEEYYGEQSNIEKVVNKRENIITNKLSDNLNENHTNIINTYMVNKIFEGDNKFFTADSNIDDIDVMAAELSKILDISFGPDWGNFSADFKIPASNPKEIKLPQIIYDYSARSINQYLPKPTLYDTVQEIVDGVRTGDAFRIWRQWFDYDFIIHVFHRDSIKARGLMKLFENVLELSKAHLRKAGVQKIRFAGEIDPRNSIRYIEEIPSRCLLYEITLEKIIVERTSTLQNINIIINNK